MLDREKLRRLLSPDRVQHTDARDEFLSSRARTMIVPSDKRRGGDHRQVVVIDRK